MAILIGNKDNEFCVQGEINKESSRIIKQYVEAQFRRFKKVIMNIDAVHKIDKQGFTILLEIHKSSLQNNKVFRITGIGCKEIYDDLLASN